MFYSKDTHYSDAEDRAFARDELVYNVTEDLLVIMEDKGISKTELSRSLGKSKSYVSQVL
ncbi:XRE family transcriptional regulator, partial [Vibrio parahaemolyticus]|nr:XRE family transcriptional regulator [Vibrio parahaemolyticus]